MSKETIEWLNTQTLIGFTEKRGTAWHYRADEQGDEPNHYPGAIPVEDVERRLFHWEALSRPVATTLPCDLTDPAMAGIDDDGMPYKLLWIEGEQRMVRPDTEAVFGNFKSGYQGHQYREWLLDNVATILDDDLGISSAGLLREGAQAWVEISVPDTITTPQGVTFRPNLLAVTSFDGSLATSYGRKVTNTVCDNTMASALGEKDQKIKFKHTRYSALQVGQAREALAMVYTLADDYMAQLDRLEAVKVSEVAWKKFLDAHVLTDDNGNVRTWAELKGRSKTMATNKWEGLNRLYAHDQRVAPWAGTAIGVVQAVNTYVHHEGIVRGATRPERNMASAIEGKFDALDQDTLDTLMSVLV
jgi:phage/plasmid-like protein (TIGR03299 family)